MSLILEALKKLERDRPGEPRQGDVVLLAPVSWPARRLLARRLAALLAFGLSAAALIGGALWLWPRSAPPPASGPIVSPSATPSAPSAAPSISTTAEAPAAPSPGSAGVLATPERPRPRPAAPGRAALLPRPSPSPSGFALTAIGNQDGYPIAVINDRVVRVGDALEGARVVIIGETEVVLEQDGRRFTVGF